MRPSQETTCEDAAGRHAIETAARGRQGGAASSQGEPPAEPVRRVRRFSGSVFRQGGNGEILHSPSAAFTRDAVRAYSPRMVFIPRTSIRLFMTTGALVLALTACGDDDTGTITGG